MGKHAVHVMHPTSIWVVNGLTLASDDFLCPLPLSIISYVKGLCKVLVMAVELFALLLSGKVCRGVVS
jgi:hypothetical protein